MKIKRMRFMTRREWVAKNYPKHINENCQGGVQRCPHDYCFTDVARQEKHKFCDNYESCDECWSQPVVIDGKYILVREED